ncbi:cuticular protein RR-1 motif 6 isoform X1 [Bombyx mori]|uniref:Cuticle protein n=1 Tax=Bombyx mori TaxID=7091 RepID=A0A8R2G8K1_BOMMO|nr:cuticular protein RR-1 motif 6 isoform X1 [Bombyx mori]
MNCLLVTLALGCVAADVSHVIANANANANRDAKIIRQELDVNPDGAYHWTYETENGIVADETGGLKNPQDENPIPSVQGRVSWTAPDGQLVEIQYVADENGYQPQGSFIPTPPPIPEAIVRALQYIQDHPPPATQKN